MFFEVRTDCKEYIQINDNNIGTYSSQLATSYFIGNHEPISENQNKQYTINTKQIIHNWSENYVNKSSICYT